MIDRALPIFDFSARVRRRGCCCLHCWPIRFNADAGAAAHWNSGRKLTTAALTTGLDGLVSTYFDEKSFGIEGSVRSKLRQDLLRAGYFRPDAINYYILARLALVVVLPTIAYGLSAYFLSNYSWLVKLGLVAVNYVARYSRPRCLYRASPADFKQRIGWPFQIFLI